MYIYIYICIHTCIYEILLIDAYNVMHSTPPQAWTVLVLLSDAAHEGRLPLLNEAPSIYIYIYIYIYRERERERDRARERERDHTYYMLLHTAIV